MYCLRSPFADAKEENTTSDYRMINVFRKKVLVLGIGNVLLKDEGIGVRVVQRILADIHCQKPEENNTHFYWPEAECIIGGTSGLDFLDYFKDRKKIIIIDAIKTNDTPGTLYKFTADDFNVFHSGEKLSVHNINLPDIVNLLKFMNTSLPEIIVIAVNAGEITPGENLSADVEDKIPDIIELVNKEVCAIV